LETKGDEKHPEPMTYVFVWVGLLVLTGITIAVSRIHLGAWNVVAALAVASVKSSLVLAYFMHLKYEEWLMKIIFFTAVATLTIIIGLTFVDTALR
jgi:cytochrome c oxidase subunit 4